MADTVQILTTIQDQYLENTRKTQEAIVKAISTWVEESKNLVPDVSPWSSNDQWPTTAEYVERSFRFTERLLTAQHEFAIALLEATTPEPETQKDGATSGARKPGAKTTATAA
ncbi:MAG: hypothetical protein AB1679_00555 [Actinomycetota bacterium]